LKALTFAVLFSAIIAAGLNAQSAEPSPVDEVVKRVQNVYARQCCFVARFDQLTVNVGMDLKDRFEGNMYVKAPNLIALEVVSPEKQQVVIRGRSYSIYFPEDGNAARGEIPPEMNVEHFFSFLANLGELDRNFLISYPNKSSDEAERLIFLELVDRQKPQGTYRIVVGIDMDQFIIRRAIIYDALGNYNRFDLSEITFQTSLPDSRFQAAPGAIDIIEESTSKPSKQ
jgi:outer membrane lipoprotein-sorting protein